MQESASPFNFWLAEIFFPSTNRVHSQLQTHTISIVATFMKPQCQEASARARSQKNWSKHERKNKWEKRIRRGKSSSLTLWHFVRASFCHNFQLIKYGLDCAMEKRASAADQACYNPPWMHSVRGKESRPLDLDITEVVLSEPRTTMGTNKKLRSPHKS